MNWTLQYGGDGLGSWVFVVGYQHASPDYLVRIQHSDDQYIWQADQFSRVTITEAPTGPQWSVSSSSPGIRMTFAGEAAMNAWVDALVEGEVDIPPKFSGECRCRTLEEAQHLIEAQVENRTE